MIAVSHDSGSDDYVYHLLQEAYNARRTYAAYMLRMVSGWVLYGDSGNPTHRKIAFIARRWIYSRDNRKVLSFENVCEALDLPPDETRAKIKRLTRGDLLRGVKLVEDEKDVPVADDDANDDS